MKTRFLIIIVMGILATSLCARADEKPATAPAGNVDPVAAMAAAEQNVTRLSTALADALKSDATFSQKETRKILKDLLEALFTQRVANPDKLAALAKYGMQLMALYKTVGVDPGIPFPAATPQDTEMLMSFALKNPYFAKEPPKPDSPQYADLKKNLPDLVPMVLATTMRSVLTSDDASLANWQTRFKSNPDLANEDASTRTALLMTYMKLLREGRVPK